MSSKRKSCPVKKRAFIEIDTFNKSDKTTFHGTETVRALNKFERKWFWENSIAIVGTGTTFYGRTFVVPYVDIEGTRYWLVDKEKKEKKKLREEQYGEQAHPFYV